MTEHVRVRGGRPLRGSVALPVDLEVAQRAIAIAALARGRSRLRGLPPAATIDCAITAWRSLGVSCMQEDEALSIDGVGLRGLQMPSGALHAGRSFSLFAILAGTLSAQSFGTRVTLDPTLASRSVEHVVGLLRARGAHIAGTARVSAPVGSGELAGLSAPVGVAPLMAAESLLALDATLPFADPDAKTAALISALFATGPTTISEPSVSADHTERLFVALGLPLRRIGSVVAFDPSGWDREIPPLGEIALPGSASIAAYLAAIAQSIPGSELTLRGVGLNPGRSGVLDLLRMWGASIAIEPHGDAALREPIGDVRIASAAVSGGRLRGGSVDGELLVRARDELPAIALLGAFSHRGAHLFDLAWLGADADPQWLALDPLLRAFGVIPERSVGELHVACRDHALLAPPRVDAADDPRLSLAACALALATPGESVVEHAAQALRAVHPGFIETARALGADIDFV